VRAVLVSAPGYQSRVEYLPSDHTPYETATEVIVHLEQADSVVRGAVQDATGGVIAGAMITARGTIRDVLGVALSGSDGSFELSARAGPLELTADAESYARAIKNVVVPAPRVTLSLVPASEVVGRVVSHDTKSPIQGVTVRAREYWGRPGEHLALTDSEGRFRLNELEAGHYQIEATGPQWWGEPLSVVLGVSEVSDNITISMVPATSFEALVRVADETCLDAYAYLSGPASFAAHAQLDGRIHQAGLPSGQYDVDVSCPSRGTAILRDSIVVGSPPNMKIWELEPPEPSPGEGLDCCGPHGTIHVVVDIGDGVRDRPVQVWTALSDQPRAARPGRKVEDVTVFEKLDLGTYDVYIGEAPELRVQVVLQYPEQVEEVRLRVPKLTRVSGRIVDDRGAPVPDAWVYATAQEGVVDDEAVPRVLSGAGGEFVIPGLFPTKYEMRAESPLGVGTLGNVPGDSQDVLLRVAPGG
jgi:hypothetical protein